MSHPQVEKHSTKDDCWMSIHGKVYDVTKFLEEHPGGEEVMLEVAGETPAQQFTDSTLLALPPERVCDARHSKEDSMFWVRICEKTGGLATCPPREERNVGAGER